MRMRVGELEQVTEDLDVELISPDRTVTGIKYSGGPDYGWMVTQGITSTYGKLAFDGTGIGVAILTLVSIRRTTCRRVSSIPRILPSQRGRQPLARFDDGGWWLELASTRAPRMVLNIDYIAKPDQVAPGNRILSILTKSSYLDKQHRENVVPLSGYATSNANSGKSYF